MINRFYYFIPNLLNSFSLRSIGNSSTLKLLKISARNNLIEFTKVTSNLHKSINPYKAIIRSIARIFSTKLF